MGLEAETACRLALRSVVGAAQPAAESPESFATLRERATSKGGTTFAALEVMRAKDIPGAIGAEMRVAIDRGSEGERHWGEMDAKFRKAPRRPLFTAGASGS